MDETTHSQYFSHSNFTASQMPIKGRVGTMEVMSIFPLFCPNFRSCLFFHNSLNILINIIAKHNGLQQGPARKQEGHPDPQK